MEEIVHIIEPAASGRAKCRGCGRTIAKDELRVGERIENPFADGLTTLWYHVQCAAYKRPEIFLAAAEAHDGTLPDSGRLVAEAKVGAEHRRLPRVNGVQRDPSGRATCRSCRERIGKDEWRIALDFYEEGRFNPAGYIHAGCAADYLGTASIVDRLKHFTPDLADSDVNEIRNALGD
ncbi:MAG: hypothetical protein KJO98_09865 [Rhodothermia bacterium]|nr:hypothetical protein [Rhodothermia bacterium]